jgi:hypothetical protein
MANHLLLTPLSWKIQLKNLSYILFKCKRALNKRTNFGNIYLVNIYIINVSKTKLNITWLTKKNGINWGIYL